LGRLLRQGAYFADAYQDHAVTETAPGHSTILSGRWPAHTGIISNVIGVSDAAAAARGSRPGASPARFRGTAFFDWLQAAEPSARALSVVAQGPRRDPARGRAKQQVYWYQGAAHHESVLRGLAARLVGRSTRAASRSGRGARVTLLLPASAYAEPTACRTRTWTRLHVPTRAAC